jgi:hypothetical protein
MAPAGQGAEPRRLPCQKQRAFMAPGRILFNVGERRGERLEGLWTRRYLDGPDPKWCCGERCGEKGCKRAEQNVVRE